jgi:hypothetical protein
MHLPSDSWFDYANICSGVQVMILTQRSTLKFFLL